MDEREAPVTEHLAELRRCVAIVVVSWIVCAIACFSWAEQIFGFLLAPAVNAIGLEGGSLQAIAPGEIFFTYLKSALLAGFILDLPIIFWQLWSFIAPGLYANEKKFVWPFVITSSLLFAGGAIFGYTQVFPLVFEFFNSFSNEFVESAWTMAEVFKLTTRLFLAFGIAFELPLLVFFLAISGIVSAGRLLKGTPYAVLIIFVAAAMLTPPDVVSQVLLGLPMIVLYLAGVGVAWVFDPARRRAKREAREAEAAGSNPAEPG
jgi:sec-independent protein translocase protein TatC